MSIMKSKMLRPALMWSIKKATRYGRETAMNRTRKTETESHARRNVEPGRSMNRLDPLLIALASLRARSFSRVSTLLPKISSCSNFSI